MLKEGYDYFELTKMPPKVDVCERRYVFNRIPAEGYSFDPEAACPPSTQPEALMAAYRAYEKQQEIEIAKALKKKHKERSPSILGVQEARLVADWSDRRARGEKVTPEPPSLTPTAVASAAPPMPPAPVPAYAAAAAAQQQAKAAGLISGPEVRVGAPPVTTGSLPVPSPSPTREEDQAAVDGAAAKSSRLGRVWSYFTR